MAAWTAFPHASDYPVTAASAKKQWARLHAGDAEPCPSVKKVLEAWALFHAGDGEPLPKDAAVLQAWVHFHNGDFQKAAEAGLEAGGAGTTAANKATAIYATYLEKKEKTRLDLYLQVAEQAEAQAAEDPKNANAWYWHAYALGRYSQGISVAKALAQGLGGKIKESLEKAIALSPKHADARIALGAFHAEVIDKVGSLIGGMTYGAKKDTGLKLFQEALKLNPGSAIAMIEYANALVMLEGDKKMKEATALYEQAAASTPLDAMERLDVDMAQAELEE